MFGLIKVRMTELYYSKSKVEHKSDRLARQFEFFALQLFLVISDILVVGMPGNFHVNGPQNRKQQTIETKNSEMNS